MKSLCATGRNLYCPWVPVAEPLAGEPAGADGDAGLDGLIARAARVLLRIHEGHDARALVVLERELPRRLGAASTAGQREHAEQPEAQPGEERDADEHRQQRHRGAEVGLLGDEDEGDRR